jgi:putative inorganic carbon (HCO3(-)) transporter
LTAELARVGGPLGCFGLAALLVGTRRDLRLAGLVAWALGALLLLVHLAPRGHHVVLAAAAVVGVLDAVAGAWELRRWPWVLAVAILACAPARFPVHVGKTQANLLLPLYVVAVAAALALAWELARGDRRVRELGPLAVPLAAFAAWTGLTLAWTEDLHQGSVDLLFFYLPFGLLTVCVARLPWSRRALALLWGQLTLMGVIFATVGIYQWVTRDVFWNPKVIVANAYTPFYRINSVFYDPSIYGRFLVLAIVVSLVVVLQSTAVRVVAVAAAAIAVMWVGLLFSFSQSSFAALIAGTFAAAAFAWRRRAVGVVALAGAVLVTAGFSTPQVRHTLLGQSGAGLNNATSGRFKLITNGIKIAIDHPVGGVGVGSFVRAYGKRLHLKGAEPKSAASHDTPVTVAAETGIPGLALFAWLIAASLLVPLRRLGAGFDARVLLAVGLGIGVIVVHSLFYNALFEDPLFWALLGLAVVGAGAARREGT